MQRDEAVANVKLVEDKSSKKFLSDAGREVRVEKTKTFMLIAPS